jgi:copper transport protein
VLDRQDADRWLGRTTRRLSIAGLLASLLYLAVEGTMRAGLSPAEMFSFGCWQAAFTASNIAWRSLGMAGLVLLAVGRARRIQGLGVACAVAAMADSGHVLSVLPQGIGHGLMILHGLAAAMWMGAIAPLRRALARDSGTATALLFRRFQTYGGLAMGATLASGLLLSWFLLPALSDLWRSDYGLRLSAKLGAVGVMVLIAGGNRLCLTRRALAGRARIRTLLMTILAFDVVAAAMATILAVGLSLGAPPARALDVAVAGKGYQGTLSFAPGKAGDNDLRIVLRSEAAAPADPQEVEVRLTVSGLEPIVRKARRIAPGRYAIDRLPLWQAGQWQVEVGLLVDDFTKQELSAAVTLPR